MICRTKCYLGLMVVSIIIGLIFIYQQDLFNLPEENGWRIVSSLEEMQNLVDFEMWVIHVFETIEHQKAGRTQLISFAEPEALEYLTRLRDHYKSTSQPYLHHPFNQFHVIRRFAFEWNVWSDVTQVCKAKFKQHNWCREIVAIYQRNIHSEPANRVDPQQVHYAVASMIVSQIVMNYSSEEYIFGNLSGVWTQRLELFNLLEFALVSIIDDNKASILNLHVTLDFWLNTTLKAFKQFWKSRSANTKSLDIIREIFQEKSPSTRGSLLTEEALEELLKASEQPVPVQEVNELEDTFPLLCREKNNMNSKSDQYKQYCQYLFQDAPYFSFKGEFVSLDPPVLVIHNFLDSKHIKKDKSFVIRHLHPAGVHRDNKITPTRITQHAQILSDGKIDFYMRQLAGFRRLHTEGTNPMFSMEPITYVNYGVQGFYANHQDFIQFEIGPFENRLATLMWYAADVKSGGATVFPHLGVVSRPKLGKALLWFNMRDGSPDHRMLHASCPVSIGNKWIATVWIREFGHEHLTVCHQDRKIIKRPGRFEELIDLPNHFSNQEKIRND